MKWSPFTSLSAIALALVMPLAACSSVLGFKTLPTYRYEVLVEVDTPEGLRRGSSVIQIETERGPGWTPDKYGVGWTVNGDAVTIDLGRRGKVFVALRNGVASSSWTQEAMLSFIGIPPGANIPEQDKRLREIQYVLSLSGWHCIVGCIGEKDYSRHTNRGFPLFVWFKNILDPSTLTIVNSHRLDRVFGNGVRLRAIKLRVTKQPVTRTIVQELPWLRSPQAVARIPDQPPGRWAPLFTKLGKSDFTREE